MNEALARGLLALVAAYLALGVGFAVAFAAFGVDRIDPAARHASLGFRIAIVPGAAALWPLLASRWISGRRVPPEERNAHRDAARVELP